MQNGFLEGVYSRFYMVYCMTCFDHDEFHVVYMRVHVIKCLYTRVIAVLGRFWIGRTLALVDLLNIIINNLDVEFDF